MDLNAHPSLEVKYWWNLKINVAISMLANIMWEVIHNGY